MKTGRRNILIDTKYNNCFGKSQNGEIIRKENGTVHDTISAIEYVVENYSHQASKIAQKLKGKNKLQTAKNIYTFCFSYFQYKPDKKFTDEVRSPNRAWSDRFKGIDCDCFVALISCILNNYSGWEYSIRMSANYKKGKYNHVYVILLEDNGDEICIDPIIHTFNKEADYLQKLDKTMQISVLNGLENPYENQERRPLQADRISIVDWITKYELRRHAKIRLAISRYAKSNKLQIAEVEKTFATLLYNSNQKQWKTIANSKVTRTRSRRNFTIRNRDVLAYLGLENNALSLAVSLLHDADVLEYWMENTLNLPLAVNIAQGISTFKQNEKELRANLPFEKIRKYTQSNDRHYSHCVNHCAQTKAVIYENDPISNLLQISIVLGSAPKGKLIKSVNRMYKPSGSVASNKLHDKLRKAYQVRQMARRHTVRRRTPLNGLFSTIGSIAGSIFGAGGAGAAVGSALDSVFGGKKKSSNKPKYDSKQIYVWPDGNPYNRKTEDETSPSYLTRINTLKKKPYALQVINKYNEIKAQKGGINPTQTEYNSVIAPFVQEAERQIVEKRKAEQQQRAEAARVKRETLARNKKNTTIKYVAIGTGVSLALGLGVYHLTKKK